RLPRTSRLLISTLDAADRVSRLNDFATRPVGCVLVTSRAGEEGLNLQFAHTIVHADAPFEVRRIEQRIGRLDRFGRTLDTIRQRFFLLSDRDDSPWFVWQELLTKGYRVLGESVSDCDFVLDSLMREDAAAYLAGGAAALLARVAPVRGAISSERQRLDEQY